MASISDQRLKEMEAEMNRFEEEILAHKNAEAAAAAAGRAPPNKMIIGARTFEKVQQRLVDNKPEGPKESPGFNIPFNIAAAPPPPPPSDPEPRLRAPAGPLPPPPPPPGQPPPRPPPGFMPPQLRHRMPPPPPRGFPPPHHRPGMMPPRPPMGGPPPGPPPMGMPHGPGGMMHPGYPASHGLHGPPGPHGPNMPPMGPPGGQYPGGGGGYYPSTSVSQTSQVPVIEKPKVVYSAPPVRNVPAIISSKPINQNMTMSSAPEASVSMGQEPITNYEAAVMPESGEMSMAMHSAMEVGNIDGEEFVEQTKKEKKEKKKKFVRTAAGTVWEDSTLAEWDPDDFRIFAGDLGNEVTDEVLARAFSKYPSYVKAKVVRDKRTNKTKGYGFVSFRDPNDFVKAMREVNGKYVGNRPIKLRKSSWKDRQIEVVKKKEKEKKRLGFR